MKRLKCVIYDEGSTGAKSFCQIMAELGHDIHIILTHSSSIKEWSAEENINCRNLDNYKNINTDNGNILFIFSNKIGIDKKFRNFKGTIYLYYDPFMKLKSFDENVTSFQECKKWLRKNFNDNTFHLIDVVDAQKEDNFLPFITLLSRENIKISCNVNVISSTEVNITSLKEKLPKIDKIYLILLTFFRLLSRYQNSENVRVGFIENYQFIENLIGFPLFHTEKVYKIEDLNNDIIAKSLNFPEILFEEGEAEKFKLYLSLFSKSQTSSPLVFVPQSESYNFARTNNNFGFENLRIIFTFNESKINISTLYNPQFYNPNIIENIGYHFSNLLNKIIKGEQWDKINYLSPKEEDILIKKWALGESITIKESIPHAFEKIVKKFPNNQAVLFKGESINYKKLNNKANEVAQYFIQKNRNEFLFDQKIGILMGKNPYLISTILGVLKAGAAYVPLSTKLPEERLKFIIEDSQSKIVITDQAHLNQALKVSNNVICIENIKISKINIDNYIKISPKYDRIAYIIYTSGSTGRPKGVAIKHYGVVNVAREQRRLCHISEQDRVLQLSPISFDASVWDIFGALLNGATVCLPDEVELENPDALCSFIHLTKITYLTITPAYLNLLFYEYLKSIKTIIVMGEKGSKNVLDKWSVNRVLINAYGPTEATVCATLSKYDEAKSLPTQIGKPIGNVNAYILDAHKNPIPIGVAGELCIAGLGVSDGYHDLDHLTANKFIKNPFAQNALEERMYCTGDLARWLPNGEIDFIGRIDRQVKINGQRVELAEIEAHLNNLASINFCFVDVIIKNQENFLVVYYEPQKKLDTKYAQLNFNEEILKYLRKYLPEYMLPHYLISLNEFPLNQNGKVDVSKLPEINYYETYDSENFIPPSTKTQKAISDIFFEIFALEKISIEQNFFRIGINSLNAMLLASTIYKKLNKKCQTQQVFEMQSISSLAQWLDQQPVEPYTEPFSNNIIEFKYMPLSPSQQRLWFIHQMEGENSVTYNMPLSYQIKGKLNINFLEKALNALMERHEMLRTVFPSKNGIPYLRKLKDFKLKIEVTKISSDSINSFLNLHASTPFNLETGPLFRVALGMINNEDFILILNKHNIITDGWSEGIILHELSVIYRLLNYETNNNFLLPQKNSFFEFSREEHNKLSSEYYDNKLDFWKKYLNEFEELKMPTDFPRDTIVNRKGNKIYEIFNKKSKNEIDVFCNYYKITPYMFFLSIFNILLHRYTGQKDILIGTVNAARDNIKFKNTVGFFANTFVLRNLINTNFSFSEFLDSIKENCLNVYPHQDLPFDQLIDKLKINRDNNKTSLFQLMLVMQDANDDYQLKLADLNVERMAIHPGSSMLDLTMNISYAEDLFKIEIEYDTALFKNETIQKFIIHYKHLIEEVLKNPNRKLSNIDMLAPKERMKLIAFSSGNSMDFKVPQDIVSNFENTVKEFSSNIAVRFASETITYEDLNNRSNRLARSIIDTLEEIPSEGNVQKRIGVCIARSIETIVAILAVLKSGNIFVPIAPEYPPERINMIANDADLSLLLVNKTLSEDVKLLIKENKIFDLDKNKHGIDDSNLKRYIDPTLPAYIIYTSGSAGKPKGVMVAHKSLINTIYAVRQRVKISSYDRLISVSSINFDMFMCDIFLPLLHGAECSLCEIPKIRDPFGFIEYFKEIKATFIEATPSFLGMVADILPRLDNSLTILTGGEELTNNLLQKLKKVAQEVFNLYGPTEAAVWSTISSNLIEQEKIDIGKPLANTDCYILNKDLQLQPENIIGELYISGSGVALGYWQNKSLTQSRFLPNPFKAKTYAYKTGDLAYWDKNGIINFVGREDRQVKVRGTRIELGEIEYVIRNYKYIEDCIVTTYDHDNFKNLVAYIIPKQKYKIEEALLIKELKDHLNLIVSKPMIPSAFLVIHQIPLTPNGKIDYTSLLSPIRTSPQNNNIKKPRTTFERKMEKIWATTLGHNYIDIEENFFDLGGNSITIPRVIFNVNKKLRQAITIREFMQNPTIASLCEYLENKIDTMQAKSL